MLSMACGPGPAGADGGDTPDGGGVEADAGATPDAGEAADAGADAGPGLDAGDGPDGGTGLDAGVGGDAGVDLCHEGLTGVTGLVHHVHHFVGEDGIDVWLTRDYVGQGAGSSSIYEATRLSVVQGDLDVCITDPDALTYDSTHHNFDDSVTGVVDDQVTFYLHVGMDLEPPYPFVTTLERRATSDGTVLAGPFVVEQAEDDESSWPF